MSRKNKKKNAERERVRTEFRAKREASYANRDTALLRLKTLLQERNISLISIDPRYEHEQEVWCGESNDLRLVLAESSDGKDDWFHLEFGYVHDDEGLACTMDSLDVAFPVFVKHPFGWDEYVWCLTRDPSVKARELLAKVCVEVLELYIEPNGETSLRSVSSKAPSTREHFQSPDSEFWWLVIGRILDVFQANVPRLIVKIA